MSEDLRPWGYAPGGYVFHCIDCPKSADFMDRAMGDKRSRRCEMHAKEARDKQAAEPPIAPPATDAGEMRERVARMLDPVSWDDHDSYLRRADEWFEKGRTNKGDPLVDGYRDQAAALIKPSLAKADQILALLPAKSYREGWQPIETAPLNEHIDFWIEGIEGDGWRLTGLIRSSEEPLRITTDAGENFPHENGGYPTHWMRPPVPPAIRALGEPLPSPSQPVGSKV